MIQSRLPRWPDKPLGLPEYRETPPVFLVHEVEDPYDIFADPPPSGRPVRRFLQWLRSLFHGP